MENNNTCQITYNIQDLPNDDFDLPKMNNDDIQNLDDLLYIQDLDNTLNTEINKGNKKLFHYYFIIYNC